MLCYAIGGVVIVSLTWGNYKPGVVENAQE